jgi:hypothetical protein
MKYIKCLESYLSDNIKIIVGLNKQQLNEAIELCAESTETEIYSKEFIITGITQNPMKKINPALSYAAYDLNTNEILGALLCGENSIQNIYTTYKMFEPHGVIVKVLNDFNQYKNLKGLETIIFGVKKEFRKTRVAHKILSEIIKINFDYLIIEQSTMYSNNINYFNKAKKILNVKMPGQDEGNIFIYDIKK